MAFRTDNFPLALVIIELLCLDNYLLPSNRCYEEDPAIVSWFHQLERILSNEEAAPDVHCKYGTSFNTLLQLLWTTCMEERF